jgi:hypothetical protein
MVGNRSGAGGGLTSIGAPPDREDLGVMIGAVTVS